MNQKNKTNEPLKISFKEKKKFKFNISKNNFSKSKDFPIEYTKEKSKTITEKLTPKQKILYGLRIFFITLTVLIMSGAAVGFLILYSWTQDMPELDTSLLQESAQSSYIYDKDGNIIAKFSSSESRSWVSIEDIPQDLIDAFISIEDIRFYEHDGVDIKRFGSAVLGQFIGASHGGSTITQQLIKNAYLTNEVTYKRKIQEILLAFQLESKMTKDEIMESYLNIIYFGESNYGVKSAAEDYFGKSLDKLTLKECAMLAGLVKNPNGYDPRRNMYIRDDMTTTNDRTETVLYSMLNNGYITQKEYDNAIKEEFVIKENSAATSIYSYPHFVEYVIEDVVDDLIEKEGLEDNGTNRAILEWRIRSGGYKIYTTLDSKAQEILQSSAENFDGYPTIIDKDGNPKNENPEVASVIMDQKNGYIVAMIGSREEPKSYKTLNRAVVNTMPVGSAIKPLSAFASAMEQGSGTGTIGYNYAFKIEGYDLHTDYPRGSMGTQKPLTYRQALETSSNVIPAKIICQDLGYDLSKQYLMQMGISEDSIQANGSGLALGTSGIDMLEMTAAYATIANGGVYLEPKSYVKVVDRKDNIILESKDYQIEREVFSKSTAWLLTNALESVISYNRYVTGAEGITTAGKSGTHEDKCSVFAAYTGYYTSVLWIGSDSYSSFDSISGARHAGVLLSEYMTKIHKKEGLTDKPILEYSMDEANVVECETCTISGDLASDLCREAGCASKEYYKEGTQPKLECKMHVVKELCRTSNSICTDSCPSWARKEVICLFIPADNYLSKITRELVRGTFPEAIFEDEVSYCSYHSSGYNELSDADISNINLLINNFENLLLTEKPSPDEKIYITNIIEELKNIVKTIETATAEEITAMSQDVKNRYNELYTYYESINNREQYIPEDNENEDEMPDEDNPPQEEIPDEDNPPQEEMPDDIPEVILPSEEPQQPEAH